MFGYKCDKCGATIYVDPTEERLCDDCKNGSEGFVAYEGICANEGILVFKEDAFSYAIERVQKDKELQKEFTEWFFSGSYVKATAEELREERRIC